MVMKSLKHYIIESSRYTDEPRSAVIALENGRLDFRQYIKDNFYDKCQIWLHKSSGRRSDEWNSLHIMVPYKDGWFVEVRLRFEKLPTYLISVVGHWSENEINVKVPNDKIDQIIDDDKITYYNSVLSSNPEKYTDTYAKYL